MPRRGAQRQLLAAGVRLLAERAADVAAPHGDELGGWSSSDAIAPASACGFWCATSITSSLVSRAEVGDARASFERHVGHALLLEVRRYHAVRARERGVGIAVAVLPVEHDVGTELVEQRRARPDRAPPRSSSTAGSGSMSTSTSSHASSASARVSATTIASGSPVTRTLSSASAGRTASRGVGGPYGVELADHTVEVGGGEHQRDAGCRRAPRSTSTDRTRPCATWLRTNAACSMPGSWMSST